MPTQDPLTEPHYFTFDPVRMKPCIPDAYTTPWMVAQKRREWEDFMDRAAPYPGHFRGRGIVTCGGGATYFTCAWVSISLLRRRGCTLPVELWYTGNELTPTVAEKLSRLDVTCRNTRDHTDLDLKGYQLKPFAIRESSFREVLFLDADNVCVRDPAYLFEAEAYRVHHALFWPDNNHTGPENPIWQIINRDAYDTPDQESGQLVLHKEKCWRALQLCLFFNLDEAYYYRILWGDKDTFRFAWMALDMPYAMIATEVAQCGYYDQAGNFCSVTMVQHDPEGRVLFLHRNTVKWTDTARQDRYWQEVRAFAPGTANKSYRWNAGDRKHPMDMQGEIEKTSFGSLFGSLEAECLDILEALRAEPFYREFIRQQQWQETGPAGI